MVHFYPHEVHSASFPMYDDDHDNCYCIVFMESKSQLHGMGATPIQCVNIATLVTIHRVKKLTWTQSLTLTHNRNDLLLGRCGILISLEACCKLNHWNAVNPSVCDVAIAVSDAQSRKTVYFNCYKLPCSWQNILHTSKHPLKNAEFLCPNKN